MVATPPFADINFCSSVDQRCFHCGKEKNRNFFECPYCIDTWFCSQKCRNSNEDHASICDDTFNREDCYIIRLATEIIRSAFQRAQNIDAFVDFCCGVLFSHKKSRNCLPPFSTYGEILQLKGGDGANVEKAHRVVKCLRTLPEIRPYLKSNTTEHDFRRICFHLAISHIEIVPLNAFSDVLSSTKNSIQHSVKIYDSLSRINHSCDPNLDTILDDDGTMFCIVRRPIRVGEQLFIDYLGGAHNSSVAKRKKKIQNIWKFNCNCNKCNE